MEITLKITEATQKLQDRLQCLQYLATHTVEVGLTSTASERSRTLLAIHEHGAPAMHIPARPVIQPALAQPSVKAKMSAAMLEACEAANDGNLSAVTSALEDAGKAGVDGIHAYIDKGVPPPNSPITLKGGWLRNPVSRKPVKVKAKSGTSTTSIVAAPHCGDGSFRLTSPSPKYPPQAVGGGSPPLVDTGQLYNDFDWEIRGK